MSKKTSEGKIDYNEYIKKIQKISDDDMIDNIEEINLANHEAEKLITLFHKAFGEYHEKQIKIENENLDSEDEIKYFFDIVVKNIRKLIHNEMEKEHKPTAINKSLNFLKIINSLFRSIFKSKSKKNGKNKRSSE